MSRTCVAIVCVALAACGSSATGHDGGAPRDAGPGADGGTARDAAMTSDSGSGDAGSPSDAGSTGDAGRTDDAGGASDAGTTSDAGATLDAGGGTGSLDANRDRLLATYLAFLETMPTVTQTNGLRGADLTSVCDLWSRLDPSSQSVYLTLTARMEGSRLGIDGSAMLDHVVTLYRLTGGQGATATSPGTCGGGEYNRMMMSMDAALQSALVAANTHRGAATGGVFDISDIPAGGSWRDSHDVAGPHSPFDLSDETNGGAPRGQVQFFHDPTSSAAMAPLGRVDLMTLVDPHALEMDQDYDCVHNSNPRCSYTTYGAFCFPMSSRLGTDLYEANYGSIEPGWHPSGCP